MITAYVHNGMFKEKTLKNLTPIVEDIQKSSEQIRHIPLEALIELFHAWSKGIMADASLLKTEGLPYLCTWLRRENLREIVKLNFFDLRGTETFIEVRNKQSVKIQPRGIVCHWIAANVPTLAFFSLVPSLLCRNGNIVRVAKESVKAVIAVLKKLQDIQIEHKKTQYRGVDILKALSIIYFDSQRRDYNEALSLAADCKIIWGGAEAVSAIKGLPEKEHCESVIFGPKYSLGVIDRGSIESEQFETLLDKFVLDIVQFNQAACNSPHVLFFEKSKFSIEEIAQKLSSSFERAMKKYPKGSVDPFTATKIVNIRYEYLLNPEKKIFSSKNLDWTILINKDLVLESPIGSRTIFIKDVPSIFTVVPLLTRRVQTVGVAIKGKKVLEDFADQCTYKGVARCVRPGRMGDYESPWDGLLLLSRLVRFVSIIE